MANETNTLTFGGVDYLLEDHRISSIVDAIYPVGSIYMSVNNANPGTLFGGTWVQITGRFLLGTGTCDDNTDSTFGNIKNKTWSAPPGTTGGEDFNQLVEGNLPAHTHCAADADTSWRIPILRDVSGVSGWHAGVLSGQGSGIAVPGTKDDSISNAYLASSTGSAGGNVAHNNMPPYFSVYIWRRTA